MVDIGPRLHLFPRDPGKDAVQGPQKLSEELERSEEFRGQFLRSEDCIFSRDPEEKVESYHYTLVMLVYHKNRGFSENMASGPRYITLWKTWHLWSTVFQDAMFSEQQEGPFGLYPTATEIQLQKNSYILGQDSTFSEGSWEGCSPRTSHFLNYPR